MSARRRRTFWQTLAAEAHRCALMEAYLAACMTRRLPDGREGMVCPIRTNLARLYVSRGTYDGGFDDAF